MMEQKTEKWRKDRAFYTILPILVFPFLTMGFWSLGGGKGTEKTETAIQDTAFNTEMPEVGNDLKLESGKLAYYERARKDSLKKVEMIKNDPYRKLAFVLPESDVEDKQGSKVPFGQIADRNFEDELFSNGGLNEMDQNEAIVMEKLQQLNELILKNESTQIPEEKQTYKTPPVSLDSDLDRLEEMMKMMNRDNQSEDREMKELKGILENILDIQHPERVSQKLKEKAGSSDIPVMKVTKAAQQDVFSISSTDQSSDNLDSLEKTGLVGFYSLADDFDEETAKNSISAVIHETQTLVTGATVKLRLLEPVRIGGLSVPKDHFLFGIASLSGERLVINIQNVRVNEFIVPVALQLFDTDGVEGIYIPGAISRDAVKQTGDRAIQGLGMSAFNPGIGAQAASAGIETAKTLISRKIKLVKVTVKAGYRVWLQDGNTKSQEINQDL